MAVQGVTRPGKSEVSNNDRDLIAGARGDFSICRRLDEGAPPEIAARPRWPARASAADVRAARAAPTNRVVAAAVAGPATGGAAVAGAAAAPPDAARVAGADDADAAGLAGAAAALRVVARVAGLVARGGARGGRRRRCRPYLHNRPPNGSRRPCPRTSSGASSPGDGGAPEPAGL